MGRNLMNKRSREEGGIIPILVLVSGVGLVAFLLITNTFSFKDNIFGSLFPKSSSLAASQISYYGKNISFYNIFGQRNSGETTRNQATSSSLYHSPGLVVDRSSTPNIIYTVDTGNNRVLVTNGFAQDKSADMVLGQPDFNSATCNGDNNLGFKKSPTAATLCLMPYPNANNTAEYWMKNSPDVDSLGNFYIVDSINNRVLKYNQPLSVDKTGGKGDNVADFVYGQPDFNSNKANQGGSASASSLWTSFGPPDHVSSRGVSVDASGNVWVADTFNNRVLRFPPNSKTADLVLGQSSFTSTGCVTNGINSAMNRFCSPILARVDPDTGNLYVIDEFPTGFHSRVLVFNTPFSNGMSASRVIVPNNASVGGTYDYTHVTGLVFNRYKVGAYATGKLWIPDQYNRLLLLDDSNNVVAVVGAKDKNSAGGDQAFVGCPVGISPKYLWSPGGAIGFDSNNNMYIPDEVFQDVVQYTLPYTPYQSGTATCLPASSGYFLHPNTPTDSTLSEAVGMTVFQNQLIVVEGAGRLKAWNDYKTKGPGTPADVVLNGQGVWNVQGRLLLAQSIDDQNRLWMNGEHGQIYVYQLPLTNISKPVAIISKMYWADDDSQLSYSSSAGIAFDSINKAMYFVNGAKIYRVKNYANVLNNHLVVDMVIGQKDKVGNSCNQGLSSPNAGTFCEPYQAAFDKLGNLFVVDDNYECHGNRRITTFTSTDLNSATSLFPNLQAKFIFNAPDFNSTPNCSYWVTNAPGSPITVAFNSKNQMVVGNDGYYGDGNQRELKQLWFYDKPLTKQTPDASIALYMGTPGEMVFDSDDNLLVQDHTWYRVQMLNLCKDPQWLEFLPGITPMSACAQGTVQPTTIPTASPTILPSPIPTSTPISAGDTTPPSAPSNLSGSAISSSQINLTWGASTDNFGVTGYNVYRNNVKVATIGGTNTSYGDANLVEITAYTYFIKAVDQAGNESAPSNTVSVTTQANPTPPPAIVGELSGIVSSNRGGVLSGAKVSLNVGGARRSISTSSSGSYIFSSLPTGTYSVNYQKGGYQNQTVSVTVNQNQTATQDVTLVKNGK